MDADRTRLPHGGAARVRRHKYFAQQNPSAGAIHLSRAYSIPLGWSDHRERNPKNKAICQRQMALFLSWCIRIDAGRTGAKGQDVRLLLRHRQGQGLTSANSYVKCRLKSDAESANMRVAHIFAHGEKSAKRLKTKGIPQTQRFAGFLFIGGGGGSRTRVRKRLNRTFSGRSQDLSIPSA